MSPIRGTVAAASNRGWGTAPWSPVRLFQQGENGFWYDASDLTPEKLAWVAANPGFTSAQFLAAFPTHALYQNSTGTTPVTALGQPVGLVLDKSRGGLAALGATIISNGTFDANVTGWSATNCSIAWDAGRALMTGTVAGANLIISSAVTTVVGNTYQVSATFTKGTVTSDTARITVSNNSNGSSAYFATAASGFGNGTITAYFTATATTTYIAPRWESVLIGATWYVDDVSVRELPGVHASQSTDASRPTLQARVNLLTYSEQFDNAAWTKAALNAFGSGSVANTSATTDPLGGNTADYLQENNVNTGHGLAQSISGTQPATSYTYSAYLKAAQRSYGGITGITPDNGRYYYVIDLTTGAEVASGVANGSPTLVSKTATSVGNGWWRLQLTLTSASSGTNLGMWAYANDDASFSTTTTGNAVYQGDGTSGIYLWGADLRLASDAAYPYQRVTTATDYADVGAPRSLAFDGVDDSLATPSIDFTATDKMTACVGVTKLQDATAGMLVELSSNFNTNTGTFFITAPDAGGVRYSTASRGTATANENQQGRTASNTYAAPNTSVLSSRMNIANDSTELRLNSVSVNTGTGDQGSGNFGNYAVFLGRRGGTTLPFNGRMAQVIVRGAATDDGTTQQTERFVAQKTGVTL